MVGFLEEVAARLRQEGYMAIRLQGEDIWAEEVVWVKAGGRKSRRPIQEPEHEIKLSSLTATCRVQTLLPSVHHWGQHPGTLQPRLGGCCLEYPHCALTELGMYVSEPLTPVVLVTYTRPCPRETAHTNEMWGEGRNSVPIFF